MPIALRGPWINIGGEKMTTGKKCYSSPLLSTLEKRNLRICMFEDFLRYLKSVNVICIVLVFAAFWRLNMLLA